MGIFPGGRVDTTGQRTEAFFSASNYVIGYPPNPHTRITPYVFRNGKCKVDIVVNMKLACQRGIHFYLGDQNAVMTEQPVPRDCIIAVRSIHGRVIWPHRSAKWYCPDLERLPAPRSQFEVVQTPAAGPVQMAPPARAAQRPPTLAKAAAQRACTRRCCRRSPSQASCAHAGLTARRPSRPCAASGGTAI